MSAVTMRALWLSKSSAFEHEWEDGFCFDEERILAAIADGASSAPNSAAWARQLTSSFVDQPFSMDSAQQFELWLRGCQQAWAPPEDTSGNWWGQAVSAQASWSTFAACKAAPAEAGWTVQLAAVGDTCWFHIRDGNLVEVFPPLTPDDFGVHPELVGTSETSLARTAAAYQSHDVAAIPGDVVLGATDALAEWALSAEANDVSSIWSSLTSIDSLGLRALAGDERNAGRLVDDDITLLRCRLGDAA